MASVERQKSSENEYRGESNSKGYDAASHFKVTSLAEKGKYVSDRTENAGQKDGTLAVNHVNRQLSEKFIGGKLHKAHYGNEINVSEPYVTTDAEKNDPQRYMQQNAYSESPHTYDSPDNTEYRNYLNREHQNYPNENYSDIKDELKKLSASESFKEQSEERKRQEYKESENGTGYTKLAADLKEQLEKDISLSDDARSENKKRSDKKENDLNAESDKEKIQKKYSVKRGRSFQKYHKKVNKANSRVDKITDNSKKKFSPIEKISEIRNEVIKPMANGEAVKALSAPARIYVHNFLKRHRLGRTVLEAKEFSEKTKDAVNSAGDTAEAMTASAQTAVKETLHNTANKAVTAVYQRHEHNKYLSALDKAIKKAEKEEQKAKEELDKTLEKLSAKENAELSKFEEKEKAGNDSRYINTERKADEEQVGMTNKYLSEAPSGTVSSNNKYITKQAEKENHIENSKKTAARKNFIKNKREELSEKKEQDEKKSAQQEEAAKIIAHTKHIIRKKASGKAAIMCISGAAPVVIIIVVILIIIAILFSWLDSFKYALAGEEDNFEASTDKEILEGYVLEIQNYFDVACTKYYTTYGTYCDAHYNWVAAELDWTEYYEKFLKPKVDKATKEIQDAYAGRFAEAAKNHDSGALSSLGQQMSKEITETVGKIMEEGVKYFNETLDALNDMYVDPEGDDVNLVKHFNPPENSETEHTDTGGSKDEVWDVGEYNGKTCDGTNNFNLNSLNVETDLTAEDVFRYIALSRALKVLNDGNIEKEESETGTTTTAATTAPPSTETGGESTTTTEKKKDDLFGEITPKEINEFFEKTEFIKIESHLEKGTCEGKCQRKLEGNWDDGFTWKYFCMDEKDTEPHHEILSGNITVKTEDELIEAIMEEYNAEGAGMNQNDCKEFLKTYKDYLDDTLGKDSAHYFGAADPSRSVSFYNIIMSGYSVPNMGIWQIDCPLETETDNDEEEKSDDKTDKKT